MRSNLLKICGELSHLSERMSSGPYFNGGSFSLVDMAAAPLLQRITLTESKHQLNLLTDQPKLAQWWNTLAQRQSIQHSVVPEFESLYFDYIKKADGYFAQYL